MRWGRRSRSFDPQSALNPDLPSPTVVRSLLESFQHHHRRQPLERSSHLLSDCSLALCSPEPILLFLANDRHLSSQVHIIGIWCLESASSEDFHHHLHRQTPERSSYILSDCSLILYPESTPSSGFLTNGCHLPSQIHTIVALNRRRLRIFTIISIANHGPRERSSHLLSDCSLALYPPEPIPLLLANGRHLSLHTMVVALNQHRRGVSPSSPSPTTRMFFPYSL